MSHSAQPKPMTVMPFILAAAFVLLVMAGMSAYEMAAFDWHPAREEPAEFSTYHVARMALSAVLAAILVAAAAKPWSSSTDSAAQALEASELRNGAVVTALAAVSVAILVWDPALFHWFAREDNILEWLSALFILIGALLFAWTVIRAAKDLRGGLAVVVRRLLIPAGFAGLFFLIAMEEISWGQRILGFDTPEGLAERNWQQEFNFHNIHTDIFELFYYLGTGAFLILLPLAGPILRDWRPFALFADFIPNRAVAVLSAPMVIFSYGHWNLIPLQIVAFIALFAMIVFARTARHAGRSKEFWLFSASAGVIAIGQVVMLISGPQMLDVPDATEFRELFLSIGLFAFAAYYAFDTAPGDAQHAAH